MAATTMIISRVCVHTLSASSACSRTSLMRLGFSCVQNIGQLHERALRFLYNDHTNSYNHLLFKSDRCTMLISCQRAFSIQIFKTVNKPSPPFIAENIQITDLCYSLRNPNDLAHIRPNQTTFGSKSLLSIGRQILNNLPSEMKSAENLKTFKRLIKYWDGLSCRCSACQYLPM